MADSNSYATAIDITISESPDLLEQLNVQLADYVPDNKLRYQLNKCMDKRQVG